MIILDSSTPIEDQFVGWLLDTVWFNSSAYLGQGRLLAMTLSRGWNGVFDGGAVTFTGSEFFQGPLHQDKKDEDVWGDWPEVPEKWWLTGKSFLSYEDSGTLTTRKDQYRWEYDPDGAGKEYKYVDNGSGPTLTTTGDATWNMEFGSGDCTGFNGTFTSSTTTALGSQFWTSNSKQDIMILTSTHCSGSITRTYGDEVTTATLAGLANTWVDADTGSATTRLGMLTESGGIWGVATAVSGGLKTNNFLPSSPHQKAVARVETRALSPVLHTSKKTEITIDNAWTSGTVIESLGDEITSGKFCDSGGPFDPESSAGWAVRGDWGGLNALLSGSSRFFTTYKASAAELALVSASGEDLSVELEWHTQDFIDPEDDPVLSTETVTTSASGAASGANSSSWVSVPVDTNTGGLAILDRVRIDGGEWLAPSQAFGNCGEAPLMLRWRGRSGSRWGHRALDNSESWYETRKLSVSLTCSGTLPAGHPGDAPSGSVSLVMTQRIVPTRAGGRVQPAEFSTASATLGDLSFDPSALASDDPLERWSKLKTRWTYGTPAATTATSQTHTLTGTPHECGAVARRDGRDDTLTGALNSATNVTLSVGGAWTPGTPPAGSEQVLRRAHRTPAA